MESITLLVWLSGIWQWQQSKELHSTLNNSLTWGLILGVNSWSMHRNDARFFTTLPFGLVGRSIHSSKSFVTSSAARVCWREKSQYRKVYLFYQYHIQIPKKKKSHTWQVILKDGKNQTNLHTFQDTVATRKIRGTENSTVKCLQGNCNTVCGLPQTRFQVILQYIQYPQVLVWSLISKQHISNSTLLPPPPHPQQKKLPLSAQSWCLLLAEQHTSTDSTGQASQTPPEEGRATQ